MFSFNCSSKDNKLFVPIDLSYQNEPPNVNDAKTVSSVLPISPVKVVRCVSESSISKCHSHNHNMIKLSLIIYTDVLRYKLGTE